jgi:hypothetical protein
MDSREIQVALDRQAELAASGSDLDQTDVAECKFAKATETEETVGMFVMDLGDEPSQPPSTVQRTGSAMICW